MGVGFCSWHWHAGQYPDSRDGSISRSAPCLALCALTGLLAWLSGDPRLLFASLRRYAAATMASILLRAGFPAWSVGVWRLTCCVLQPGERGGIRRWFDVFWSREYDCHEGLRPVVCGQQKRLEAVELGVTWRDGTNAVIFDAGVRWARRTLPGRSGILRRAI